MVWKVQVRQNKVRCRAPPSCCLIKLEIPELPEPILRVIEGHETATHTTDVTHRLVHSDMLKHLVDHWIEKVPLGHVDAFSDELFKAANKFIKALPPESARRLAGAVMR